MRLQASFVLMVSLAEPCNDPRSPSALATQHMGSRRRFPSWGQQSYHLLCGRQNGISKMPPNRARLPPRTAPRKAPQGHRRYRRACERPHSSLGHPSSNCDNSDNSASWHVFVWKASRHHRQNVCASATPPPHDEPTPRGCQVTRDTSRPHDARAQCPRTAVRQPTADRREGATGLLP